MAGKRRGYDRELRVMGVRMAVRVEEDVPFCWMCPAESGQRAKEHVFARSLQKELGAENERFNPTHVDSFGRIVSQRRSIPAKSLLAGEVCMTCNTGWMSELEVLAAPLLLAGVRGQERAHLGQDEQTTLARWFFKTAIVLNSSQNYRLLLPKEVRHSASSGLHPDVRVFVARRDLNPEDQLEFSQGFTGMITSVPTDRLDEARAIAERIHVGWIGVADWYGAVVYAPPGGWAQPDGDWRQVWPYEEDLDWPALPLYASLETLRILTGESPDLA